MRTPSFLSRAHPVWLLLLFILPRPLQPAAEGSERAVRWLQTSPPARAQVRTAHPDDVGIFPSRSVHERHHRSAVRAVPVRGTVPGGDEGKEGGWRLGLFRIHQMAGGESR